MCGRFTQYYTWAEIHAALSVFGPPRNLQPRYNIAPTDTVDVVRPGKDGSELVQMRWGLIPSWWKKSAREVPATFNARADSVDVKPMFRDAFKRRRCIIPASGFYEWTGPKEDKQGHLFTAADGAPVLAIAGLWDEWRDPAGERVASCTMIVGDASDWMRTYHDRLVLLLQPDRFEAWLEGSIGKDQLQLASGVELREWCVSRRMNASGKNKVDEPDLVAPVAC